MQSNMAATLNIDWLLDVGLRHPGRARASSARASDLLAGLDDRVLDAARPAAALSPLYLQAGERGPFLEPAARAQFTGLMPAWAYADLMRAVFEGLCLAARDCYAAMGPLPREVRLDRRRGALQGDAPHPRRRARRRSAAWSARRRAPPARR